MIHALLSGTLAQDPAERQTSKGARFITTSLRVSAGTDSVFIGCSAFETSAAERLSALRKGAAVAIAGELQLNVWQDRQGVERRDWRIVAAEVLTLSQAKRRKASREPEARSSQADRDGDGWVPAGAEYLDA